jgi:hypothetical protein
MDFGDEVVDEKAPGCAHRKIWGKPKFVLMGFNGQMEPAR